MCFRLCCCICSIFLHVQYLSLHQWPPTRPTWATVEAVTWRNSSSKLAFHKNLERSQVQQLGAGETYRNYKTLWGRTPFTSIYDNLWQLDLMTRPALFQRQSGNRKDLETSSHQKEQHMMINPPSSWKVQDFCVCLFIDCIPTIWRCEWMDIPQSSSHPPAALPTLTSELEWSGHEMIHGATLIKLPAGMLRKNQTPECSVGKKTADIKNRNENPQK